MMSGALSTISNSLATPRLNRLTSFQKRWNLVINLLAWLATLCQTLTPREYAGVTYFKQLEGFAGGAYVITYSKYVNTIVIHTYPYQAF